MKIKTRLNASKIVLEVSEIFIRIVFGQETASRDLMCARFVVERKTNLRKLLVFTELLAALDREPIKRCGSPKTR